MLLSFSIDAMLPAIVRGYRQHHGEDIGTALVKRQTIRRCGPKYEILLARYPTGKFLEDIALWWKSRTPARHKIGNVTGREIYRCNIYRVSEGMTVVRIDAPNPIRLEFHAANGGGDEFTAFAVADGFDTAEEFINYFVPKSGDTFPGVLFKW